jgi:outer membrane protein TolC
LTITLGLLLKANRPALAAEPSPANAQVVPSGPLTFEDCVRLAIHQSPYFTRSALEIEVRRINETDSRYAMFPPHVTFQSYYYVDRPSQPGLPQPYYLNFFMEPYNPFGSYFTLQAQKAATQMTIFFHLQMISQGLERLGKMFLSLAAVKQLTAFQNDLVNLCRENLTYAENRRAIGTGTSLEVRLATQELEVAKSELARLEGDWKRTLNSLKNFIIGLKPEQTIDLDLRDARRQVLSSFNPAAATLEQAKARSYELKAMALKMELQKYNVALAKVKVLPNFLFNTQTPSPLSITTARGFYVGLGLELPVWDGFDRIRNISRQKTILKQLGSEKDEKEIELTDKWNDLQEAITANSAGVNLAKSQEELARLKERQAEIRYDSGNEQLPAWLEARKAVLDAHKGLASKALEYDQSIVSLRQLSGDLGYSYVDEKSWQR